MELVARQGHYLKPFAKILLAMANLRDKKPTGGRNADGRAQHEYPENPLFKKELMQLSPKISGKPSE